MPLQQASRPPLLLVLAGLGGCGGWVTTSQFQGDAAAVPLSTFKARKGAINRLWSSPPDSTSTRGLGGGITYAWDPQVCGPDLHPKFSENGAFGIDFAGCDDIAASSRRAFKSWSDNHPKLKFYDVGLECELKRRAEGLPLDARCDLAEIWLTSIANTSGADAAATTVVTYTWATDFTHTNGAGAELGVWEATSAQIGFNANNICWYLDATFCGRFHSMKRSWGVDGALTFIRLLIFGIWGIAVAETFWRVANFVRKQYKMLDLSKEKYHVDTDLSPEDLEKMAMEFYYQMERMVSHLNSTWVVVVIVVGDAIPPHPTSPSP